MSKSFGESLKMLGDLRGKIEKMKEEAGNIRVEGVAGGGMVKVAMNGRLEVLSVEIEQGILNPGEKPFVQDLVAAAINSALAKAQAEMRNKLGMELLGLGVPLPDLSGIVQ